NEKDLSKGEIVAYGPLNFGLHCQIVTWPEDAMIKCVAILILFAGFWAGGCSQDTNLTRNRAAELLSKLKHIAAVAEVKFGEFDMETTRPDAVNFFVKGKILELSSCTKRSTNRLQSCVARLTPQAEKYI